MVDDGTRSSLGKYVGGVCGDSIYKHGDKEIINNYETIIIISKKWHDLLIFENIMLSMPCEA